MMNNIVFRFKICRLLHTLLRSVGKTIEANLCMNEKSMLQKSSINYLLKALSLEANKFMHLVCFGSLLNRKADDFHNS